MKTDIVLRQSDFWAIQGCKRKFFLNNVANISFPESSRLSAANQGTLLHAGLTGYHAGLQWEEELNKQAQAYRFEGKNGDEVNDALDMAHSVVADYIKWVHREGHTENLGAVAMVEERLEMVVYEDDSYRVIINGQADLIWERALWDFKTKGRIESQSPVLGINNQLLTYLTLTWMTTEFRPKQASHINILRKANNGTSKAKFFQKDDVYVTENQLKIHWQHMQGVAKQIVELYDSTAEMLQAEEYPHEQAPPNPGAACSYMCPFVGVCESLDKTATTFQSILNPIVPDGGIFS